MTFLRRRISGMLLTLFGVTIIIFLMVHFIPGNPVDYILGDFATQESKDRLTQELGLDRGLITQYFSYLTSILQLDFGTSFVTGYTVKEEILHRIPITAQLALYSVILGSIVGITLGSIAAVKKNTIFDRGIMFFALIGISAPGFWIALFLILIFSYHLSLFPISSYSGPYSLVLPAITLALGSSGTIARITRSSMLDVLNQDYIRTAFSKGSTKKRVIYRHALKNALIPVTTIIGMQLGYLLAGAVVTESVFALPGIGSLVIESIATRDLPMIQGIVLFISVILVVVNFLVDILYTVIDPRIKLE